MTYLHQLYGLNPGDSRYRSKLKSRKQNIFPSELIFVKVKTNTAEIVLSKTVFDNTVHYSTDKDSPTNDVASTSKSDIAVTAKFFQKWAGHHSRNELATKDWRNWKNRNVWVSDNLSNSWAVQSMPQWTMKASNVWLILLALIIFLTHERYRACHSKQWKRQTFG